MRSSRQYFVVAVVLLTVYLLSACDSVLPQNDEKPDRQAAIKVNAVEVAFTGVIETMNGNQWIVDGQDVTVDATIIHDGPFTIGDTIKIEGKLDQDGVIQATKIENPDFANPIPSPDPVETQSPEAVGTQEPVSTDSPNPDAISLPDANNKVGTKNDDNETFGTVEAINGDIWTINGKDYLVADFTEFKGLIEVGESVKVHVIINTDGTLTIREIERSKGFVDDSSSSDDDSNHDMDDDQSSSNSSSNDDSDDDHDSSSDDDSSSSRSEDMDEDD